MRIIIRRRRPGVEEGTIQAPFRVSRTAAGNYRLGTIDLWP
jgi:hypothetical protein